MNGILDFLATGFYSGKSPVAQGTCGTLLISLILCALLFFIPQSVSGENIAVWALVTTVIGIVVSGAAINRSLYGEGEGDPKPIVIDEFAGFLVSLAFLPVSVTTIILAFAFFRFFDITKPIPVRSLEHLPGGFGVVLDDVAAGIFANLVLRIVILWYPAFGMSPVIGPDAPI
jgi:phosphatidylglycerophosphatase A